MRTSARKKIPSLLARLGCTVLLAMLASIGLYHGSPAFAASHATRYSLPNRALEALKRYTPEHATSPQQQLHLAVSLNLRNRAALNALIAAQNDPQSPSYHHYLTPQQFTAEFGPTQATVASVISYLQGQGLHVASVAPNHMLVDVSGSVATAEKAFGVTLNDYRVSGRVVYAPTAHPTIPDTLSSAILNIEGLDNLVRYQHAAITRPASPATGPNKGYTPAELRDAYDVNALMSNGGTGAGQTTALFELDGYNPADIATYLNYYHISAPKYSNVLVDDATNTPGDGAVEVELDMEVLSALAPDAAQNVYIGPNTPSGINDTYNKIVTDDQAKVVSTSWGTCEQNIGDAELTTLDNIFAQGAAQGQAFFAASGDSGAYACGDPSTLAVSSPADDPYVVGVGGTSLQPGSNGAYGSESAWSNKTNGEGGGGGISAHFTRPAYQTGTNLTNLNREVPDVSADADPSTGYSIYCTVTDPICVQGGWSSVGGTSAAAPLWAALATDTNEYLSRQGKSGFGNALTSLYALYNTHQAYSAYHDITSGNNLYYQATAGYDNATGIGTPDAWNIARDLLNLAPGGNHGPTQLLQNAGFDDGLQAWTEHSSGAYEIVDSTKPHAGGTSADLCGYATCDDSIGQTVTLPASTNKIVLSYWVYVDSQSSSGHVCQDAFFTRLRTSNGRTIATPQKLCNTQAQGWKQYTFDVTSALTRYAGKRVEVEFHASTTPATATAFFVDDVALTVTPA